jgi:hypothetical protein
MSDRGVAPASAVVSLEPKAKVRPEANDPLERAGHLILDMVGKAANAAEANYQHALETSRTLSGQLRGAEDKIRELEARVRHHEDRADRAEKWLHRVAVEIEEKFFRQDKAASR